MGVDKFTSLGHYAWTSVGVFSDVPKTTGGRPIAWRVNDVNAVCVMLDGWTDRYKALSYNAIRVSFIKEWQFYVVTLSCEVLVHHTGYIFHLFKGKTLYATVSIFLWVLHLWAKTPHRQ